MRRAACLLVLAAVFMSVACATAPAPVRQETYTPWQQPTSTVESPEIAIAGDWIPPEAVESEQLESSSQAIFHQATLPTFAGGFEEWVVPKGAELFRKYLSTDRTLSWHEFSSLVSRPGSLFLDPDTIYAGEILLLPKTSEPASLRPEILSQIQGSGTEVLEEENSRLKEELESSNSKILELDYKLAVASRELSSERERTEKLEENLRILEKANSELVESLIESDNILNSVAMEARGYRYRYYIFLPLVVLLLAVIGILLYFLLREKEQLQPQEDDGESQDNKVLRLEVDHLRRVVSGSFFLKIEPDLENTSEEIDREFLILNRVPSGIWMPCSPIRGHPVITAPSVDHAGRGPIPHIKRCEMCQSVFRVKPANQQEKTD